ncbi:MAG TPA: response regulator [Syntrophales bacterium]|nr:response regulator [Syntrophales bacterium]
MIEKKILVVDDEVLIIDLLKTALSSAGYTVLTAGSAEEAMEILKRESVMVMFLDLNLPGMNGLDLCKKIRKKNTIGIIFAITGYSNFYGLLDCRTVGFDDFFIKPVKLDVLLKSVQEAFERLDRWAISDYDLA